ncbi:MAG: hypothetical protein ABIH72_00190 [archaeon]
MEFIKKAVKVGNSAGVILPRSLLGSEVKISVIRRPLNIKKDVLKILENYLENIIGIYIVSQEKKVEILVISSEINKQIATEDYKIDIVPLNRIKSLLKQNKQFVKQKIKKSKVIFNSLLLGELKGF